MPNLLSLKKSRRKNRNTFSTSRKIGAAISGAESMSAERPGQPGQIAAGGEADSAARGHEQRGGPAGLP